MLTPSAATGEHGHDHASLGSHCFGRIVSSPRDDLHDQRDEMLLVELPVAGMRILKYLPPRNGRSARDTNIDRSRTELRVFGDRRDQRGAAACHALTVCDEAGGRHVVQQRGEPPAAAGEGLGRNDRVDQPDRALFEQVPGGAALLVADDDRAGGEPARALDPARRRGLPAGQCRVPVEQVKAGGQAAQDVFDRVEPDRDGAEDVGIKAPPEYSLISPGRCGGCLECGADRAKVGCSSPTITVTPRPADARRRCGRARASRGPVGQAPERPLPRSGSRPEHPPWGFTPRQCRLGSRAAP